MLLSAICINNWGLTVITNMFWIFFGLKLLLENWSVFTIIAKETVRNGNRAFPKQDKFNRPSPLETETCPSPHPPTVLKEANSLHGLSAAKYDSLTPFSPKELTG